MEYNIPKSFKDREVRQEIYQELLTKMIRLKETKSDHTVHAFLCFRLMELKHKAISDLMSGPIGTASSNSRNIIPLHILLPELKRNCITGDAAWSTPYDYDYRIDLLNKAIKS